MSRGGAVLVGAIVALLVCAAPALAHLTLQSFTPADDATLQAAPPQAIVVYDKDVGDAFRDASLVSPSGARTSLKARVEEKRIILALPAKLGSGTWTVEWAVTGTDGHPQRETRTFSIERATPAHPASDFPADTWRTVSFGARIMFFGGLLLFVGGGAFALIAAPGFVPARWGAMAVTVVFGAWLALAAHAAVDGRRSVVGLLDPRAWFDAITSSGGRGYALAALLVVIAWRIGAQALTAGAWRGRGGSMPWGLVVVLALAAMAPTLTSHAMSSDARLLRIPLDMVHLAAGAIWIGGLAQLLALTIPRRSKNPGIPTAIERYSYVAFAAIMVVVATGAFAAWTELDGDLGSLLGDGYGRLVLAKIVLLAATTPFAWANRQRNVPALRRVGPDALPQLRRYVRYELVIAACIVVATAALVHQSPQMDRSSSGDHDAHMTT